jgi:DNA-binding response OmpR family regulator
VITAGDVEIHLSRREVLVAGRPVPLSRRQFQLLALVAQAGGAVCTRERVVAEVWDNADQDCDIDEQILALRMTLGRSWLVVTVQDVGYRLGRPPAGPGR